VTPPEIDPDRFTIHHHEGRGFRQAYVRENRSPPPASR
jgi:hypothetical protein